MSDARPIGIFDSGIGGLTVLREIHRQWPGESCMYLADALEAPYGNKEPAFIRTRCERLVEFLLAREAKAIVVACNTASVVALAQLRERFDVPFVGIVPAVKPAAQLTRVGKIGVMATPATARSRPLAELIQQFTLGAIVITEPCDGLAELIEAGDLDGPQIDSLLHQCLNRMLAEGVDVIALGCTHYPLARPAVQRVCGPHVTLVDPSGAVARQLGKVLAERHLAAEATQPGSTTFLTTGDAEHLSNLVATLGIEVDPRVEHVEV
jgi:glutamate racemase